MIRKFACMTSIIASLSTAAILHSNEIPDNIRKIMDQDKYQHSTWGLYAKDAQTGQVLYDLNSNQMFLPASTTKLFSMAALLHAYGDDYRFKTPVYAVGKIQDGTFYGNLVLVAQGDLTFGGRQSNSDTIEFTNFDHIYANTMPGVTLTKENPLNAFIDLAKQVRAKGIKQINGDVLIDDRLFDIVEKRGTILSPIMLNENLIDIVLNPAEEGQAAKMTWRPQIPGYTVTNEVKTVAKDASLDIQITSDEQGRKIVVKGRIPVGKKDLVRTFAVKNASHFARAAFIQALRDQGIIVYLPAKLTQLPAEKSYSDAQQVALWTSPPLIEYAKLVLKVSHNTGANLAPLLLAAQKGEKSYESGMRLFGDFVINTAKISPDTFVFLDAAGGDENRLTPQAEVQMLEYVRNLPEKQFKMFLLALPILGVDGSMADFAKKTDAVGKVYTKPGTGVVFNTAVNKFFLTTQALGGYINGKNGHLIEFMLVVNNGKMPAIEDIFAIFEDESQITAIMYELSN